MYCRESIDSRYCIVLRFRASVFIRRDEVIPFQIAQYFTDLAFGLLRWLHFNPSVRILYVRNLMLHTTEEALKEHFNRAIGACDAVERVKKIRDYAFVHFRDRIQAAAALHQLDGKMYLTFGGAEGTGTG
ncbi:unnamed protein product [Echinostoma caproni]|uniref:RRM domain-containing protein n=1 Tax=Echinostoma caproni TaxID=27848 RepID=A0A183B0R8_9TREM|nr:unnamed protein product [Echinostoma caproni]